MVKQMKWVLLFVRWGAFYWTVWEGGQAALVFRGIACDGLHQAGGQERTVAVGRGSVDASKWRKEE